MERILVASRNPVKLNAVTQGFALMFPDKQFQVEGISVPSNVKDQPMYDEETFQGAKNRLYNLSKIDTSDYWVSIEGGICEHQDDLCVFGWVIVKSKEDKIGKGRSATFMLPEKVAQLIREGMELGEADDKVFGGVNSKQKEGTIGKLTGNVIDRTRMYLDAVVFALIPFKNPELYK